MTQTEKDNFYVEPVEIEIYLKKSGTIKTIIKDLFIKLVDVEPAIDIASQIFKYFKELDQPIDLMEAQNIFPQIILPINVSYYQQMDLYEKLSMYYQAGIGGSIDSWRQSLYLTELLFKFEPTLAALEYLGDFHTNNLNYLIRKLNNLDQVFTLEDETVMYLINRHRKIRKPDDPDMEFEKLVELWKYNIKEKLF